MTKIALTGHRPQRLNGHEKEIIKWLNDLLSNDTYEEAYCGMAQGADLIFGKVCQKLDIPVICCYPYKRNQFRFVEQDIIDNAKDIRFMSDKYSKQSYWIRDKYMVDNCDTLIAVWDGIESGGTWITIEYARKIGKNIIYYPQELLK